MERKTKVHTLYYHKNNFRIDNMIKIIPKKWTTQTTKTPNKQVYDLFYFFSFPHICSYTGRNILTSLIVNILSLNST